MLTTVVAVISAVALLLPGFVIAEIAKSGRARASEGDLELALRALFYALILHVAFAAWTRWLALHIHRVEDWTYHLNALLLYAAVVLVVAPVVLGLVLNLYLRGVEARQGSLTLFQRILGGRDARDAWDFLFPQFGEHGAWLIVQLSAGDADRPRLVGGKYGKYSAVGQSPSKHDLYLQEMWTVSETFPRNLVEAINPRRGILLPSDEIEQIQVLNPPEPSLDSKHE